MFASQLNGKELVTIEGLVNDKNFDNLRKAFKKNHALQCGYCTPGFLVTIIAFLNTKPKNVDVNKIREMLSGNICRCTGYTGIINAVKEVIGINEIEQKTQKQPVSFVTTGNIDPLDGLNYSKNCIILILLVFINYD